VAASAQLPTRAIANSHRLCMAAYGQVDVTKTIRNSNHFDKAVQMYTVRSLRISTPDLPRCCNSLRTANMRFDSKILAYFISSEFLFRSVFPTVPIGSAGYYNLWTSFFFLFSRKGFLSCIISLTKKSCSVAVLAHGVPRPHSERLIEDFEHAVRVLGQNLL
jgi:hypothetical protein